MAQGCFDMAQGCFDMAQGCLNMAQGDCLVLPQMTNLAGFWCRVFLVARR